MKIHDCATAGNLDGVQHELAAGVAVDVRDERDYTPLALAAASSKADAQMLQHLLDAGANANALVGDEKKFPLQLAASSGDLGKVERLLAGGANVNLTSAAGYTALVSIIYSLQDDDQLLPVAKVLVDSGADLDLASEYDESPISVAAFQGRFRVVQFLIDAGADPLPLRWTPLARAIALGSVADVQHTLDGNTISYRDRCDRTPWLLAAFVGDQQKAELLLANGSDVKERGRMGDTALMICCTRGHAAMVRWLLSLGADVNATDSSGNTALMFAAQEGHANCVQLLLDAGAIVDQKNEFEETAVAKAANEPTARLLIQAGEDIANLSTDLKRQLIGLPSSDVLRCTAADYEAGRRRRFGRANPEVMSLPFWDEMIRTGMSAYHASMQFGNRDSVADPVWCFARYGMSFTELPDGRFVQIGGEHEDFYDQDFCIYNDVVNHDRSGTFQVFGYTEDLFPPTDFHSATYFNGSIWIVGRLGYSGRRNFGTTPVYRLACSTWHIEQVTTEGDNPGWIFGHRARLEPTGTLLIWAGEICHIVGEEEAVSANTQRYRLDFQTRQWTCLEADL
jgi:ankyrin repeat protein